MKFDEEIRKKSAWFYTPKCDIYKFGRYCVAPVAEMSLP